MRGYESTEDDSELCPFSLPPCSELDSEVEDAIDTRRTLFGDKLDGDSMVDTFRRRDKERRRVNDEVVWEEEDPGEGSCSDFCDE